MEQNQSQINNNSGDTSHTEMNFPVAYALELRRLIELKAYYKAEHDGFKHSAEYYWKAAENELQSIP